MLRNLDSWGLGGYVETLKLFGFNNIVRKNWENKFIKCRIVGRVVAFTKGTWHFKKKKKKLWEHHQLI